MSFVRFDDHGIAVMILLEPGFGEKHGEKHPDGSVPVRWISHRRENSPPPRLTVSMYAICCWCSSPLSLGTFFRLFGLLDGRNLFQKGIPGPASSFPYVVLSALPPPPSPLSPPPLSLSLSLCPRVCLGISTQTRKHTRAHAHAWPFTFTHGVFGLLPALDALLPRWPPTPVTLTPPFPSPPLSHLISIFAKIGFLCVFFCAAHVCELLTVSGCLRPLPRATGLRQARQSHGGVVDTSRTSSVDELGTAAAAGKRARGGCSSGRWAEARGLRQT